MNKTTFLANARIRGIYSTALTKLLLENGFQIVQPSVASEERFGLEEYLESPDLDIYDRPDWQGVHVLGKACATNAFVSMLRTRLEDVVLRRWVVSVNGVYKGLIKHVDSERGLALVDIGPAVGWLQIREAQNIKSKEVVVQVQRRRMGAKEPSLSANIKTSGEYAVLIPRRQIKISRRIRDHRSRVRLYELGKEIKPDWGIIWRTAAASQPSDVLRREIADLVEKGRAIKEKAEQVKAPALLWEESYFIDVEFPALSKKKLDEIRSSVVPTIDGHHFYKICGGKIGSAVDMAEKLLEKGRQPREVEELFKRVVKAEFPTEGSTIEIDHVKLDGRIFHLGRAQIVAFDQDESSIRYCRVLKTAGGYDGLGTPKEQGDRAVTETKIGEWHLKTKYFSRDGRYKGMYINLNTPVELYPHGIRYVDLEVDIVVQPNGEATILDEDKLEKRVEEGLITQGLVKIVRTKLKELLEQEKIER